MKTLYIMRHAKSSWDNTTLSDFDRPLNKRGKISAPLMGEFLNSSDIIPNLILSSPANRAKSTAKIVADITGYGSENIKYVEDIYSASLIDIQKILWNIDASIDSVMLVGHNPELTSVINRYSKDFFLDNLPTAGIVALRFDSLWSDIPAAGCEVVFYQAPKLLDSV